MAQTVEQLLIRIDATTEVLRRELKKADASMGQFERGVGRSLKSVERQFSVFKRQIAGQLAGIFSIFAVTRFTQELVSATDTMKELRAQIGLVTNSQDDLNRTYNALFDIANRTGQSLDATVTLFARMARNTEDLNVSQEELLRVTETVNKAFVVSGATAREASNAMIQLSQAFGKGRLDGEEFNAVAEQAPIILDAFAKQMNTTKGQLKQFAEDGKISVEGVLLPAFRDLAKTIDEDFAGIPVTVGRAMQAIENVMTDAFGSIESTALSESLKELQDTLNSDAFRNAAATLATGMVNALGAMTSAVTGLVENLDFLMGALKAFLGIMVLRMIPSMDTVNKKLAEKKKRVFAVGNAYSALTMNSRSAAVAMYGLAGSMAAVNRAMDLFGGPVGLGIIAISIIDQIGSESERAVKKLDELNIATQKLRESTEDLTEAERGRLQTLEEQKLDVLISQYEVLTNQLAGLKSKQIDEVIKTEGIERLQAALDGLNKEIKRQAELLDSVFPKLETVVDWYEEITGVTKQAAFSLKTYSDEIQGVVDAIKAETDALGQSEKAKRVAIALAKVEGKITEEGRKAVEAAVEAQLAKEDAIKRSTIAEKKAADQARKNRQIEIDRQKSLEEYLDDLRFEIDLIDETVVKQELLTVARRFEIEEDKELLEIIEELITKRNEETAALEDQGETATKVTRVVREEANAWVKAMQDTVARIDDAFANAWKGAFDSFEDFADGLKNAFRQLIGELAHIAITKPIIMSIGASFGAGAASAAAAGGAGSLLTGGAGGALSTGAFTGGLAGVFGGVGGLYQSAGLGLGNLATALGPNTFLGNLAGNAALSSTSTGLGYSYGSTLSNIGNFGLNIGAGFAGNYLSNKAFGDTTGIGSALFGTAGSIFGPLGTLGGSFIGGGVETLLGNAFGFGGKGGNQAGRATLNLSTGELSAFGVGKKFDQENVDAAQQLAQTLQAFSNIIGGSTAAFNIKVGNRSGLAFDGQKFGKDSEAFLAAAFKEIVEGSTNLSKVVKTLVQNFEGTAAETMAFTEAIALLNLQITENPVSKAVEDFAAAQEAASRTLTASYELQLQQVKEMIFFFDGSAEAAVNLNAAMAATRETAYQLALSMEAVSESTRMAVKEERRFFMDAVRSPDEQLQQMQKELEFFFAALPKMTDAGQIQRVSEYLLELNRSIFEAGPDDLQRANVDTYIDFAEKVGQVTQTTLAASQVSLEATQENLNAKVSLMLNNAAAAFQEPADTMMNAAELIFSAAQTFASGQTGQYGEVAA